jgi:hypothetical protein
MLFIRDHSKWQTWVLGNLRHSCDVSLPWEHLQCHVHKAGQRCGQGQGLWGEVAFLVFIQSHASPQQEALVIWVCRLLTLLGTADLVPQEQRWETVSRVLQTGLCYSPSAPDGMSVRIQGLYQILRTFQK